MDLILSGSIVWVSIGFDGFHNSRWQISFVACELESIDFVQKILLRQELIEDELNASSSREGDDGEAIKVSAVSDRPSSYQLCKSFCQFPVVVVVFIDAAGVVKKKSEVNKALSCGEVCMISSKTEKIF